MQLSISREMDRLEKHMTFLASVGSVAPFMDNGLFGTVWGIMNSFQSVATKNTSLAVVAPGIAEAPFRDGAGLDRSHTGCHRL